MGAEHRVTTGAESERDAIEPMASMGNEYRRDCASSVRKLFRGPRDLNPWYHGDTRSDSRSSQRNEEADASNVFLANPLGRALAKYSRDLHTNTVV